MRSIRTLRSHTTTTGTTRTTITRTLRTQSSSSLSLSQQTVVSPLSNICTCLHVDVDGVAYVAAAVAHTYIPAHSLARAYTPAADASRRYLSGLLLQQMPVATRPGRRCHVFGFAPRTSAYLCSPSFPPSLPPSLFRPPSSRRVTHGEMFFALFAT